MATRPAQGKNEYRTQSKRVVARDNVNTGGKRAPKVNNNQKRRAT